MAYSLVVGSLEPEMKLSVSEADGPADLTDATAIELQWLRPDGTVALVPLIGVDLANGIVKRVWSAGDTDIAGTHQGRVIVTPADLRQRTYPRDGTSFLWVFYPAL